MENNFYSLNIMKAFYLLKTSEYDMVTSQVNPYQQNKEILNSLKTRNT